jgi:transketolase
VKAVNPKYETLGHPSVSLEDIKHFRQLESRCPGHPEYRWTSGVETTTGPLGQGVATSVGMAIASKWMAAQFNRPDFKMFDYDVYALGGDGCMMEGVSGEAASLAGHLKLDNLVWIYDNNRITIEGDTKLAFSEDVATRFISYGWNVTRVGDANDLAMLDRAFDTAKKNGGRPTLIIGDSHIGYGSPAKPGSPSAHGEPLGVEGARPPSVLRLAGERDVPRAGRGTEELRRRHRGPRGQAARGMDAEVRVIQGEVSEGSGHAVPHAAPPASRRLGQGHPDLPRRREGRGRPRVVLEGPERGGQERALAHRGLRDLTPSTKTRISAEGAGDFEADNYAGRNCASASASLRWARS